MHEQTYFSIGVVHEVFLQRFTAVYSGLQHSTAAFRMTKSTRWSRFLTLKRPGFCGSLRPTPFKPRLDCVGSGAQVRRYCVDSAAQAFIHALAGCVPRSLQYALCGPRNSRFTHFAAFALDVLAQPMSLLVSHNLVHISRVKMFTAIFFVFWHWCLTIK